jgi:hypothetical protein
MISFILALHIFLLARQQERESTKITQWFMDIITLRSNHFPPSLVAVYNVFQRFGGILVFLPLLLVLIFSRKQPPEFFLERRKLLGIVLFSYILHFGVLSDEPEYLIPVVPFFLLAIFSVVKTRAILSLVILTMASGFVLLGSIDKEAYKTQETVHF